MKNFTTLLFTISIFFLNAQLIEDSVSNGTGYATQSFYSLENGEVLNTNNKNWDISFSMSGNGADGSAAWLNELNGDLWASVGDTSTWVGFDTTGYFSWNKLMNSDEKYKNGAFNKHRGMGPGGTFDMGWGYLDPSNNFWTIGDSLYLWKSANNDFKKIWIQSLKSGVWEFKYADLDGNNEHSFTIDKNNYPKRNFVYFSLENNTIVDREPDNDIWDLTFIGQKDELFPGMVIKSVQVFSNRTTWTAKAYKSSYADAIATDEAETVFSQQVNNIGREWKTFSGGQWYLYDTIAYFVYDQDSVDLYRMVFTGFTGSGTGMSYFNKEKIVIDTANSINDIENIITFSVYPNPANEVVSVFVNLKNTDDYSISIYSVTGKLILKEKVISTIGMNYNNINISTLEKGMYFVKINGETFSASKRLLVE